MNEPIAELPSCVRELLWEYDPSGVSWEEDRDLVIQKVLARGSWEAVRWVRRRAGDRALAELISRTRGRWLSRRQLRFWQLVLSLPEDRVTGWLEAGSRTIWEGRAG